MDGKSGDIWSAFTALSQEFNGIKNYLCPNCNSLQDIQYLKECGHVACTKCLKDDVIKCPECKKLCKQEDICKYENLDDILKNIQALSDVSNCLKEHNSTKIITYFSPESTINKRDYKGETRLHKDCRDGKLEKVEALLKTGVDVNTQDFAGLTALHEAVMAQKVDISKLLLDYGAFVNIPGPNYDTPLHIAIQKRNISLAKLLVEYGADLMMFDKDGNTPMDLCSKADELRGVLCLTPRRSCLYKIYTIPIPKVFYMDLDDEYAYRLSNIANVTISTEHNLLNIGDITYLIVGNNDKFNTKHLQAAILQGACVVNTNWIDDVIEKKSLINPAEYIAPLPKYALHKAFMNTLNKLPKLFDGLQFYFCHNRNQNIEGRKYTIQDLKMLVTLGGGKVLARRPHRLEERDICYPYHSNKDTKLANIICYLIYDEEKPNNTEHALSGAKFKPSKWLIGCINNFCIID